MGLRGQPSPAALASVLMPVFVGLTDPVLGEKARVGLAVTAYHSTS